MAKARVRSKRLTAGVPGVAHDDDDEAVRREARPALERAGDLRASTYGKKRQMAAIFAAAGRAAALGAVDTARTPTLVVHGANDRFVRTENGRLIHAAIVGSQLLEVICGAR